MIGDKTVVKQVDDEVFVEEKNVVVPIEDVKLILSVIDAIAKRGGFLPVDFKTVGDLFEKLSVHVKK